MENVTRTWSVDRKTTKDTKILCVIKFDEHGHFINSLRVLRGDFRVCCLVGRPLRFHHDSRTGTMVVHRVAGVLHRRFLHRIDVDFGFDPCGRGPMDITREVQAEVA